VLKSNIPDITIQWQYKSLVSKQNHSSRIILSSLSEVWRQCLDFAQAADWSIMEFSLLYGTATYWLTLKREAKYCEANAHHQMTKSQYW
jgi:hypothetical protein